MNETNVLLEAIASLDQRLDKIEAILAQLVPGKHEKEWHTTSELAEALNKSLFTVTERYCNSGRIECEKDPESDKWRIPAREFRRLVNGGVLRPRKAPQA
jgi:hypothetical protein